MTVAACVRHAAALFPSPACDPWHWTVIEFIEAMQQYKSDILPLVRDVVTEPEMLPGGVPAPSYLEPDGEGGYREKAGWLP